MRELVSNLNFRLKRFYLAIWYMDWLTKYNREYSKESLRELVIKLKSHYSYKKPDVDVFDTITVRYNSLSELDELLRVFIDGYDDIKNFRFSQYQGEEREITINRYIFFHHARVIDLHYIITRILDNTLILLDKIHVIRSNSTLNPILITRAEYGCDTLLKEIHWFLHFYFIQMAGVEELKDF